MINGAAIYKATNKSEVATGSKKERKKERKKESDHEEYV